MPFVTVPDGTRLSYEEVGAGDLLLLTSGNGRDAWDLLPTIHAPTLVIHGSDDQGVPMANASLLVGRIPGTELSIIQGGGMGLCSKNVRM